MMLWKNSSLSGPLLLLLVEVALKVFEVEDVVVVAMVGIVLVITVVAAA